MYVYSPDSLKSGFRDTRRLELTSTLANPRLVSFAHSSVYSILHYKLTLNYHESYSIVTSSWPRVLAGVPY